MRSSVTRWSSTSVLHPPTQSLSRGQDVTVVDTRRPTEPFAYFLRYRAHVGPPGFRLVVPRGDGGLRCEGDPRQQVLDADHLRDERAVGTRLLIAGVRERDTRRGPPHPPQCRRFARAAGQEP